MHSTAINCQISNYHNLSRCFKQNSAHHKDVGGCSHFGLGGMLVHTRKLGVPFGKELTKSLLDFVSRIYMKVTQIILKDKNNADVQF